MGYINIGKVKLFDTKGGRESQATATTTEVPVAPPETKSYKTAEGETVVVMRTPTGSTSFSTKGLSPQDYMAKKAGTYGKVSVPTSELVRAANLAVQQKGVYGVGAEGQRVDLTEQQRIAVQLSPYFESYRGGYGELGKAQAESYYASQQLAAPKIKSFADLSKAEQERRGIFYTPTEATKARTLQTRGEVVPKGYEYLPSGILAPSTAVGSTSGGFLVPTTSPLFVPGGQPLTTSETKGMIASALFPFFSKSKAVKENITNQRQYLNIELAQIPKGWGGKPEDIVFATTPRFEQETSSWLYKIAGAETFKGALGTTTSGKGSLLEGAQQRAKAEKSLKEWGLKGGTIQQFTAGVGVTALEYTTPQSLIELGAFAALTGGAGLIVGSGLKRAGVSAARRALIGKTTSGALLTGFAGMSAYGGYQAYKETGSVAYGFGAATPGVALSGLGFKYLFAKPSKVSFKEVKVGEGIQILREEGKAVTLQQQLAKYQIGRGLFKRTGFVNLKSITTSRKMKENIFSDISAIQYSIEKGKPKYAAGVGLTKTIPEKERYFSFGKTIFGKKDIYQFTTTGKKIGTISGLDIFSQFTAMSKKGVPTFLSTERITQTFKQTTPTETITRFSFMGAGASPKEFPRFKFIKQAKENIFKIFKPKKTETIISSPQEKQAAILKVTTEKPIVVRSPLEVVKPKLSKQILALETKRMKTIGFKISNLAGGGISKSMIGLKQTSMTSLFRGITPMTAINQKTGLGTATGLSQLFKQSTIQQQKYLFGTYGTPGTPTITIPAPPIIPITMGMPTFDLYGTSREAGGFGALFGKYTPNIRGIEYGVTATRTKGRFVGTEVRGLPKEILKLLKRKR